MRLIVAALTLVFASSCNWGQFNYIKKVLVTPSDNLETVRVAIQFSSKIQSDLAGGFNIKDYGYLYINPYSEESPFEVGFDLNTDIVNDQDWVNIEPTSVFPNGLPIGIPYPVVEVRAADPISDKFDLYAYIDVPREDHDWEWLGLAAIFSFISDEYFPPGLAITQVFLYDDEGDPGVIASVFGPTLNNDGTLARAGGIALMANVIQLIDEIGGGNTRVLKAIGKPVVTEIPPRKQL